MNRNMPKKALKWAGIAFGGLVGVIVIILVVLYFVGGSRVNKTYDIEVASVAVSNEAGAIERGRHVVEAIALCQECHGENLAGDVLEDSFLFGEIMPSNLTSGKGGVGGAYTDADFARAIRHGITRQGKGIIIMPSEQFNVFGDEDLGAIIAYLRSLPPVDNELPKTSVGPLARLIALLDSSIIAAQVIDHTAPRRPSPTPGVTPEYGEYLATICTLCHGDDFGGGPVPDDRNVFAPNITQGGTPGTWSEADFINTIRTGVTPGRNQLDEENMPWNRFRLMTDDELRAIWSFLSSLPAVPPG